MQDLNTKEQKKSTFRNVVIAIMVLEAFVLSGIIAYLVHDNRVAQTARYEGDVLTYQNSEHGKYVLYIGLNDKDTYEQVVATEEAKKLVNAICEKHVDGYTVSEACGGWVDEKGNLTKENTLVYSFSGVSDAELVPIMDEVLKVLNQNSILIERQDIDYNYYNGK